MNPVRETKNFVVYADGETVFDVNGAVGYYIDEDASLNFFDEDDEVFTTFAPYSWLCVGVNESEEQA